MNFKTFKTMFLLMELSNKRKLFTKLHVKRKKIDEKILKHMEQKP